MSLASALVFFLDQAWWAWSGWPAIAAVAQGFAAAATLATVLFLWRQIVLLRRQARDEAERRRKDFELAHTPLVSIKIDKAQASGKDDLDIWFHVNLDGQGVAYNVIVSISLADASGQIHAQPAVFPYLHAPASREWDIVWHDPEMMAWSDPKQVREVNVEVVFTNIFNHPTRFRHTVLLNRHRRVQITDAPTYLDLTGKTVELGS